MRFKLRWYWPTRKKQHWQHCSLPIYVLLSSRWLHLWFSLTWLGLNKTCTKLPYMNFNNLTSRTMRHLIQIWTEDKGILSELYIEQLAWLGKERIKQWDVQVIGCWDLTCTCLAWTASILMAYSVGKCSCRKWSKYTHTFGEPLGCKLWQTWHVSISFTGLMQVSQNTETI